MLPATDTASPINQAALIGLVEGRLQRGAWRKPLPAFWYDVEVRRGVIGRYGRMTYSMARDELVNDYGAERAPSRTAIGRFWQKIDGMLAQAGASTPRRRR